MVPHPITLILDTGPLSHFAQTGHIKVIEELQKLGLNPKMPREVVLELKADSHVNAPALQSSVIKEMSLNTEAEKRSLDIRHKHLRDQETLADFLRPPTQGNAKNAGEAACIAYAETSTEQYTPWLYIDDWRGRDLAWRRGLVCLTTLDLLACLARLGVLTLDEAEAIVDDLHRGAPGRHGYSLPVSSGIEFSQMYQLSNQLPPPTATAYCEGCLTVHDIEECAPANRTHFLCHLVAGWTPPSPGADNAQGPGSPMGYEV